MAGEARPAARHAESHDAHIARRRQDENRREEEVHRERDAVEEAPRAVEGLHASRDVEERESDRDRQQGNIDTSSPGRHRAHGGQRRDDKVGHHEAAEDIWVDGSFAQREDRGAGPHDQHGIDEQQPDAPVDSPALLHRQSDGAENNREPACGNVDGQQHVSVDCTTGFEGMFRGG